MTDWAPDDEKLFQELQKRRQAAEEEREARKDEEEREKVAKQMENLALSIRGKDPRVAYDWLTLRSGTMQITLTWSTV